MLMRRGLPPGFAAGMSGSKMAHSRSFKSLAYRSVFIPPVYPILLLFGQPLKEKEAIVRDDAARALGQIGATEAIPALLAMGKEKDAFVRSAAARAIKLICKGNS